METKQWGVRIDISEAGDNTHVRAVLSTMSGTTVEGVGHARRNPRDRLVPEIGDELAAGRALIDALYRAAKANPGRRVPCARGQGPSQGRPVARVGGGANNGAPGIDKTTLAEVEEYGVARLLDEVAEELREGRYRPLPTQVVAD
jgi:uncharacterized Zn-binding protein involved in type VI secretion